MAIEINFEIILITNITLLFSILYFVVQQTLGKIILSIITAICWFSLGLGFIIATPTLLALSFLFFGIGLVFIVLFFVSTFDTIKESRRSLELK